MKIERCTIKRKEFLKEDTYIKKTYKTRTIERALTLDSSKQRENEAADRTSQQNAKRVRNSSTRCR